MNLGLFRYYDNMGVATVLIALAIIFLVGFGLSRLTKMIHLPNVTAYIIAGVIIGPCVLDLIPHGDESLKVLENMSFLSDLALGFIAFGVGKFFKKNILRKAISKTIVITLFESLLAGLLVTAVCGVVGMVWPQLGIDWPFACLLGAIATATAPASTMMTIKQYKAKGDFVDTLLQVVALDDIVCLLVFSIVAAIVQGTKTPETFNVWTIFEPILYNIGFIIIGFGAGFILGFLIKGRSKGSQLICTVGMVCLICGGCTLVSTLRNTNVSPLLACMMFGAVYINFTKDEQVFKFVDRFTPPIMLLFFVMSGMNMDITAFTTIGIVGVIYFIVRIIGKYFGAYFGCSITGKEKATKINLGLTLIPQAGVAIGLAFMAQRMLDEETGKTFLSIILCSSVLYEMAGPILAKVGLVKSGAITKEMLANPSISHSEALDNQSTLGKVQVSDIEGINNDQPPISENPIE